MAGGHFYLGGGTAVQQATGHDDSAEEMYEYLVAVSNEPDLDKIRAYCGRQRRALRLVGGLGLSVRAQLLPGQGGRPARHRGAVLHRQRDGLAVHGAGEARAARSLRAGARRTGWRRDGHRPPAEAGRRPRGARSATRSASPNSCSTRTAPSSASAGSTSRTPARSRPRSVIIAAGGFAMNPDMVGEHTPLLGQKRKTKHHGMVEPYILGNPYDDGLGIRMGVSAGGATKNMDQMFITAAAVSAGDPAHRGRRQPGRQALRRRGLLPLAHVGVRDGAAGAGGVPRRRRGTHGDAADAVDQVHRRLGDGRGDGDRPRHPRRQPGRHAEPVQRTRRQGRGPRLSQAAGLPCATRQGAVGSLRPVARRGDVLRVHHGWTGDEHRRRGAARRRQRRRRSLRRGRLREQHRPGRHGLLAAARSSARDRSSAAARAPTRPPRARQSTRSPTPASRHSAGAEQFEPVVVVLLDGAAVADADHDAVGQTLAAAPGTARTPDPRRVPRWTRRGTPPAVR